ncbi:MAG TPA: TonB-dependent receptor plug domain-containing protein [Opitutaceae bacterium]|nr:TonB-dependent receptor plug domain-containing protein [Opitutaceae bacterium]
MHPIRPLPSGVRSLLSLAGAAVTTGLFAQTAAPAAAPAAPASDEDVVVLSPFEVTAESSSGYVATQTLAGSRINTRLEDVGSAISVVTAEFLKDTGATDNKTLLAYTTNTEVGGTQGNFTGASISQTQDEGSKFTSPNQNTRVRGLTSADNTRNFFLSDIPWDGYNVDRVDMQRGPNSILFGLGSPAGLINATTKTAQHRTFGEFEFRYGSFGANRQTLDLNQNILEDELSVRLNLLRNDEKFKQKPAYSLDRRLFATLRYDPKFLSRNGHKTTVKVNYESGSVRSNNPRTVTPGDRITNWWDKMGQAVYNPAKLDSVLMTYADGTTGYEPNTGQWDKFLKNASGVNTSTPNPTFQPWLGQAQYYGGIWMPVNAGETSAYTATLPEFSNIRGLSSTGATDGSINGLPYYRRVTVAGTGYWADTRVMDPNGTTPFSDFGGWINTTLSNSSVFDFYNNLIDGENKREWQNFHNFNATLTQTFFKEKLGFEAAYDQQRFRRGQYAFDGAGTLYVDINSHNIDGTPNPNVGKPYILTTYGYGNNSGDATREASRLSAYFAHDFSKGGRNGWLMKLLGRHTLSALYSQDMVRTDNRNFIRYGTDDSFGAVTAPAGSNANYIDSNFRRLTSQIYLSNTALSGASTYNGLYIPRAGKAVEIPSEVQYRYFDSTWNATGVSPGAAWTNPLNGRASTQSENPANYVGWTSVPVKTLSAENGDQDLLTTSATLSRRKVDSRAAVLQSYFWDGAIVGMYGIRADHVKMWGSAGYLDGAHNRVDFSKLNADGELQYATAVRAPQTTAEKNSPSWSIVAKLNKFAGKYGERFPIKVSLYYNESENFQVAGFRTDIHGNPLPLPSGTTNERGIMISTPDDRFTFRVNKYETKVFDASSSVNFATWYLFGGDNFFIRMENRADAYEYHLTELGNPNSVAGTGSVTGSWVWRYAPRTGETQDQADALAAAAVAGWRAYTKEPIVQGIIDAWGFNDFNVTQLTTMATPPANFTVAEDQVSKGWEYEFTANPTKNWRITVNASKTEAMRNHIGGALLREFIALTNTYMNGPMGQIRTWGGNSTGSTALVSWNGNFFSQYTKATLQEGSYSAEFRKWRFNLITNYNFTEGRLKGVNVGGGYRWQDKVAIGYPMIRVSASEVTYDIDNPYWGPSQDAYDFWIGYERKLTEKIDWRIQLNIRNLFQGNEVYPIATQYDGTPAQYAIKPGQTWTLTNTFRF